MPQTQESTGSIGHALVAFSQRLTRRRTKRCAACHLVIAENTPTLRHYGFAYHLDCAGERRAWRVTL